MKTCADEGCSTEILAAALLHDVLEDTKFSEEQMLAFLRNVMPEASARRTLSLVVEMTDVYTKENFPLLNRRARKAKELERIKLTSPDAQTIKYADILDNAPDTTQYDPGFAAKMLHEYRTMLKTVNRGNQELYNRARNVVEECLRKL